MTKLKRESESRHPIWTSCLPPSYLDVPPPTIPSGCPASYHPIWTSCLPPSYLDVPPPTIPSGCPASYHPIWTSCLPRSYLDVPPTIPSGCPASYHPIWTSCLLSIPSGCPPSCHPIWMSPLLPSHLDVLPPTIHLDVPLLPILSIFIWSQHIYKHQWEALILWISQSHPPAGITDLLWRLGHSVLLVASVRSLSTTSQPSWRVRPRSKVAWLMVGSSSKLMSGVNQHGQ